MESQTRQTIIESAIAIFGEVGFANTELDDVLERAGVTWDKFFANFPTKDALAVAIIEQADTQTEDVMLGAMSFPASSLENLIVTSLVITDMAQRDPLVQTAHALRQRTLSPGSATPRPPYWAITETAIKMAITDGDLREDIDVDATVLTIQAALLGSNMLAGATAEDVFGRIAKVWATILRAIAHPARLPALELFVDRVSQQYSS